MIKENDYISRYSIHVLEVLPFEDFLYNKSLNLFKEKGFSCVECGTEAKYFLKTIFKSTKRISYNLFDANMIMLTKDHIIPRSKGGKDCLDNLAPMCELCNGKKGCTLPEDAPKPPYLRQIRNDYKRLSQRTKRFKKSIRKYTEKGYKLSFVDSYIPMLVIDPINQNIHFSILQNSENKKPA